MHRDTNKLTRSILSTHLEISELQKPFPPSPSLSPFSATLGMTLAGTDKQMQLHISGEATSGKLAEDLQKLLTESIEGIINGQREL